MLSIDLNCDLGEGCANDAELMKYISSANIACGFHAGNRETMPAKSTYFYPKLLTGLVFYQL